jgi:DNA-binding protein HU-beta
MTKKELIKSISKKSGISNVDAKKALNAFTETVIEELREGSHGQTNYGHQVTITGFGTFWMRWNLPRMYRNPRTGKKIYVKSRYTPTFKPGKWLKEAVIISENEPESEN